MKTILIIAGLLFTGWKAISYHKTESGAKIQRDFNKEYTMYEESEYRVFTEVLQD